ncbi:BlaI/MecI/CopY family transcriptional regulator [Gordonia hydrophobica]|uniref:BlaI/MecI/CopY family transcriptional regulator n=1 Tax=Gordonia hydrophobica TaxID=40516 RepID=A0ABZ2U6L2_9ACTN|nr:BlaI/MecI/CopY family transcriptional regulator [Gordonia hydrophobica]MBM7365427.1 putative transcriptional regulator [Gordonia hydrophobica]
MSAQPMRLGPLEQQVMDILWDAGPSTVREIIDALPTPSAYTTIATVLHNLDRKKLVSAQRRRRSVHYRAKHSRDQHAAQLMNQALASSKDRAASILHFVDTISDDDAALLREYLQRPRTDDQP